MSFLSFYSDTLHFLLLRASVVRNIPSRFLPPLAFASIVCTFQELQDLVFDQKFAVVGEELPVKMGFENIIFVMEDIDAASPIVQSRDRSKRKKRGTKTTVKVRRKRAALACLLTFSRICGSRNGFAFDHQPL